MSLRILGGTLRNRTLKSPKGPQTRPTLAVVRKAVFDILQFDIENAAFLDLCAGTGAMGLEALSRGAKGSLFVETDRYALSAIYANIEEFGLESKSVVWGIDVLTALKRCAKQTLAFDVIYVDPPYDLARRTHLLQEILHAIDNHGLLLPSGTLFIEETVPPTLSAQTPPLKHLNYIDQRQFSQTLLHQYRAKDKEDTVT